jgi:ABC-type sugar transport system ATPase subunit
VGENGAGKSTFMKILSGVWPEGSYSGDIFFLENPLKVQDTLSARELGISIIHQELCLFPKLSVAENIFLTEEAPYNGQASKRILSRVDWKKLQEQSETLFRTLGFNIPSNALIEDLSIAQKQLVEIAKAMHQNAKLLILDEPTSALSEKETQTLFHLIRKMKKEGMSFIYISHKLEEVFALSDRIVVLRDGKTVANLKTSESTQQEVIEHMVGRPFSPVSKKLNFDAKEPILKIKNLSLTENNKPILKDISFELYPGEILGIAGLMGAGRSELLKTILGLYPGERKGEIIFSDHKVSWRSMGEALNAGVSYVPEDRKKEGLFLSHSVNFNASISILKKFVNAFKRIDSAQEEVETAHICKSLKVKYNNLSQPIRLLSGGNQQKVLLGKMIATNPKIIFLDEPTRGIDLAAKEEIYEIIKTLSEKNIAVLLVSSELPELLNLSHRVLVLKEGQLVSNLQNNNLTQEKVMENAWN